MPPMDIYSIRRRNLEILIAEQGTVAALANQVGTDQNYLSALRKPRPGRKGMGSAMARKIEQGVKKPTGWMDVEHPEFDNIVPLSDNGSNVTFVQATLRRLPVISWVRAGQWTEAVDMFEPGYAEEWETTDAKVGEKAFELRVEGDSMTPEFSPGALIIVDPDVEPENGDFVVAKINGHATFKKLSYEMGRVFLKPLNDKYDQMELTEEGEIIGKVVGQTKKY